MLDILIRGFLYGIKLGLYDDYNIESDTILVIGKNKITINEEDIKYEPYMICPIDDHKTYGTK